MRELGIIFLVFRWGGGGVQREAFGVAALLQQATDLGACGGGVRAGRFAPQDEAHFVASDRCDVEAVDTVG